MIQNKYPHCGETMWEKLDKLVIIDGVEHRVTGKFKVEENILSSGFGIHHEGLELSPEPTEKFNKSEIFWKSFTDEEIVELTDIDVEDVRRERKEG